MTDKVTAFAVSDALSPACNFSLTLTGSQTSITYSITATPRKSVY